ncbi:histidine kinase [Sphingorhabdus lutea]|uniref:Histidine kinase n=1 Tax=Sphingorhabdus lutea TaxID=1913578 RepID=A0A1L3JEP6_9SPHN|nr:histidine kinase [Sphingorhabdus lutea]
MENRSNIKKDDAFLASIHFSPIATVVSDPLLPDNPIIEVNQPFCDLTGYTPDEILGRNCRFLAGPKTEPWVTEQIKSGVSEQRPTLVEILNYKKNGDPFRNAVMIAPVFDDEGEIKYFIGSQVELPDEETGPSSTRYRAAVGMVKELSPRQLQVLKEMANGFRSKQIAYHLNLSERTVKMHRSIVLKKLGSSSLADAVRLAVEAGL